MVLLSPHNPSITLQEIIKLINMLTSVLRTLIKDFIEENFIVKIHVIFINVIITTPFNKKLLNFVSYSILLEHSLTSLHL
jgi:hypothetical protein